MKNGFDEFFGYHGGGIDYISHTDPAGNIDLYENDKPVKENGYMTDLLMEKTIAIIRQQRTKPFFLSLMFNAPHWPGRLRATRYMLPVMRTGKKVVHRKYMRR